MAITKRDTMETITRLRHMESTPVIEKAILCLEKFKDDPLRRNVLVTKITQARHQGNWDELEETLNRNPYRRTIQKPQSGK
jgi:hypothetical protein